MKSIKLILFTLVLFGCSKEPEKFDNTNNKFSNELAELKDYFQIPGMAATVIKGDEVIYQEFMGVSDVKNQVKLNATHLFPIASLTKIFSGVLIMKLLEQHKLSLDDPIKKYIPESTLSDSIQVKHILSHTSQGKIGEKFYYSSRFSALTKVIEKASGKDFGTFMKEEIFEPLALKDSYLLKDSTQIKEKNLNIAKPYVLDDGVKKGFIDFGFSSSAGIVSNLKDLISFDKALNSNKLISEDSKNLIFEGLKPDLPYGYGVFKQDVNGVKVIWGYGQYDCFSSLYLKVPEKDLTLILLANNNLMSDPARLIYGDVSSSLFALSFLKNYVFNFETMKLLEDKKTLLNKVSENTGFYRQKLLSQALAESFMSRFDTKRMEMSEQLIKAAFAQNPEYLQYADINLLHTMSFLKSVAFYRDLGEFTVFDSNIERIAEKLLEKDSQNPYINSYMGTFYYRKGNTEKAKHYFENIVNAENFSKNWYTIEAQNWLNNLQKN